VRVAASFTILDPTLQNLQVCFWNYDISINGAVLDLLWYLLLRLFMGNSAWLGEIDKINFPTAYCDHTFPRRHDPENSSWERVWISKPRSRFDVWSKSLLPKFLHIEPRHSRLLVIELFKKLCIWPGSCTSIVQYRDKHSAKFSFLFIVVLSFIIPFACCRTTGQMTWNQCVWAARYTVFRKSFRFLSKRPAFWDWFTGMLLAITVNLVR
jgi:hypothetical protein